MKLREWLSNIVISHDSNWNAYTFGSPVLTMSARAATGRRDGKRQWIALCALLEFVDHGHVQRAVENNRRRLQAALRELEGL
jgi:hypothetical protein